jgi:hypothetical protein
MVPRMTHRGIRASMSNGAGVVVVGIVVVVFLVAPEINETWAKTMFHFIFNKIHMKILDDG